MSIAHEPTPRPVADLSYERARLHMAEPTPEVTSPKEYPEYDLFEESDIEQIHQHDQIVRDRYIGTIESINTTNLKLSGIRKSDLESATEHEHGVVDHFEHAKSVLEREAEMKIQAIREELYRAIQNKAHEMRVGYIDAEAMRREADSFVVASEVAKQGIEVPVTGGLEVQRQFETKRDELITYINELVRRYRTRVADLHNAEADLIQNHADLSEYETAQSALFREERKDLNKEAIERTRLEELIVTRIFGKPQAEDEDEQKQRDEFMRTDAFANIFENEFEKMNSDELINIRRRLALNHQKQSDIVDKTEHTEKIAKSNEIIIENATAEIATIEQDIFATRAKLEKLFTTIASQIESQSTRMVELASQYSDMVTGNIAGIDVDALPPALQTFYKSVIAHHRAIAVESDKAALDVLMPSADTYIPTGELLVEFDDDEKAVIDDGVARIATRERAASLFEGARLFPKIDLSVIEVARRGLVGKGLRSRLEKITSTTED